MAQVINTNSLSLLTQNNLNKSQSALGTAIERLSSGLRINSAKDDAAGQAIANRFTANTMVRCNPSALWQKPALILCSRMLAGAAD